ncbi:MAG: amidotransferase [Deltaproteobacteria bacterium]|nr:amidotransferase [Deltaproteobacteria bacterium]
MMKKLLVFQHVAHEILGTLNPLLKSAGFRIRYVNFGRHPDAQPSLEGYHGLVVLGGPMSVNDDHRFSHLTVEMKLIEDAMARNLPVLGICLGAQLIAKTLGAAIYPNHQKEIGWYDLRPTVEAAQDALLKSFGQTEKVFQWHGDTFDIPTGAVHLAASPLCSNQAFRYSERVYGLQFHLEVDEPMIRRWLRVPGNRDEIASLHGDIDPDQINVESETHIRRLHKISDDTFSEFIRLFGVEKTLWRLPSR